MKRLIAMFTEFRDRYLLIEGITLLFWFAAVLLTIRYGAELMTDKGEVAALAALITIFGVSTNNFLQSLGGRARERAKREFDVKKSVYLELAESIAKKWVQLSRLLRLDLSDAQITVDDFAFAAAGNRVRIFGSALTLQHYEVLQRELVKFELDIRMERRKVVTLLNEIKQIDAQYAKNQESMGQINTYLQNTKPTGFFGNYTPQDHQQIKNLQNQFAELNTANAALVQQRQTTYERAVLGEKSLMEEYILRVANINPITLNLLISIRQELDIDLDTKWYFEFVRTVQEEIGAKMRAVIAATHEIKRE